MNRIDRLHAILTHLQSKKRVTAQEMADRFHISLRTVYRDVKALAVSGVPVIGEAGNGYEVMEGYRLPPVMFTREEASALLLGSKLAEQFTDGSVRKHYAAALFKIKAVLRSSDKDYVDHLADHIEVFGRSLPNRDMGQQSLYCLQQAIVQKRVVRIGYQASADEPQTQRDVEPFGLWYYGSAWHLIAWCRLRKDYRDFRLSRMQQVIGKEECFDGNAHPSIQEYIRLMRERLELHEAVIRVDSRVVKMLGEQKYYYGFVSEEKGDGCVRMKFLVGCLEHFGRWLLTLTDAVKVESPQALHDVLKGLAGKVYLLYLAEH